MDWQEGTAAALDSLKRMRWDGRARGHHEAWYTTMNQAGSGAGFWIRYAIVAPRAGNFRAQIWFVSSLPEGQGSAIAVAQSYALEQFSVSADPFSVRIGPCVLAAGRMTGMVDAAGTPVTWDLVYEPVTDPLYNLPEAFYRMGLVPAKFLTPHPFMMLGGRIQIADRSFILSGDPGQQGHIWGRRHAEEWTWFHCSSFTKDDGDPIAGYVTGVSARPRVLGGWLLPPLSFGHLVWSDTHVRLRPATPWQRRWQGPWEWQGVAGADDVKVTLEPPWEEMVLAQYLDPAGVAVYCHHTDRAGCQVRFRAPRQPPRIFSSRAMAHLEVGSRSADPRAARKVILLE